MRPQFDTQFLVLPFFSALVIFKVGGGAFPAVHGGFYIRLELLHGNFAGLIVLIIVVHKFRQKVMRCRRAYR